MQITINDPTPKTADDVTAAYNAGLAAGDMQPFFMITNYAASYSWWFKDANGQNVAPVQAGTRYKDSDWPAGAAQVIIVNPPQGYVLDQCVLFTQGQQALIWPAAFTTNGPAALGTPTSIGKATPAIQIYGLRQLQ